jgi:3-phosphoshikimate 1-carboxyvinyltransferase
VSVLILDPRPMRPVELAPPQSKSDAQRALVLAHAIHSTELAARVDAGARQPRDVRLLREGVRVLESGAGAIECMDGGAPLRFLLAQGAVTGGAFGFTGTPRLGERPIEPLLEALQGTLGVCGLKIDRGSPWPIQVRGVANARAAAPVFSVDSRESSQFATSLLLACASLQRQENRPWSIALFGRAASAGYLAMTVSWLERTGFTVEADRPRITVAGWKAPASLPQVPGDWSSLAYLLLIAWKTGGTAVRADTSVAHPDRAIVRFLEAVGLEVDVAQDGSARVKGSARGWLRASAAECPDLIPTLCALACVLPEPSHFEDIGILRDKESDRREGIRSLVTAAGGKARVDGGTLVVEPPTAKVPFLDVDSRGDHRLALSAATLACLLGTPLRVTEPDCVEKSFPGFWDELSAAGASVRRTG